MKINCGDMNNSSCIKKILAGICFLFCFSVASECQNLLLKAKNGNTEAQYELANQYYKGIGQIQSYSNAFVWYKRAAEKNHLASCYALGTMYEEGKGCTQNQRLAFSYYIQAAERGNELSQLKVAKMFDEGEGVIENKSRAYLWYRICAERGDAFSCRRVGDFYFYGDVIGQDLVEAKYWYEKAAEQNEVYAMQNLAYIYVIGKSIAPNYQKADSLIAKPLQEQLSVAQYVKGFLLENGYYGANKKKDAINWYKKSAKQDCIYAKEVVAIDEYMTSGEIKALLEIKDIERSQTYYILGKEYVEGKKIKKNLKKGLDYLNKSALNNNEEANIYLAKLYSNGKILKKNTKKATSYYQTAASLGNKEAQQWLDRKKK